MTTHWVEYDPEARQHRCRDCGTPFGAGARMDSECPSRTAGVRADERAGDRAFLPRVAAAVARPAFPLAALRAGKWEPVA